MQVTCLAGYKWTSSPRSIQSFFLVPHSSISSRPRPFSFQIILRLSPADRLSRPSRIYHLFHLSFPEDTHTTVKMKVFATVALFIAVALAAPIAQSKPSPKFPPCLSYVTLVFPSCLLCQCCTFPINAHFLLSYLMFSPFCLFLYIPTFNPRTTLRNIMRRPPLTRLTQMAHPTRSPHKGP